MAVKLDHSNVNLYTTLEDYVVQNEQCSGNFYLKIPPFFVQHIDL